MSTRIKDELLAIKAASEDGMLHAAAVVAWAKDNPESALFAALEWDDEKAANEYRLHQVRRLIALHVVTLDGEPQLVSLSFDRSKGGGYRSVDDVTKDRDLSAIMLADALSELERVQAKYEAVKELTVVWAEVRRVKGARRVVQKEAGASAAA